MGAAEPRSIPSISTTDFAMPVACALCVAIAYGQCVKSKLYFQVHSKFDPSASLVPVQ